MLEPQDAKQDRSVLPQKQLHGEKHGWREREVCVREGKEEHMREMLEDTYANYMTVLDLTCV